MKKIAMHLIYIQNVADKNVSSGKETSADMLQSPQINNFLISSKGQDFILIYIGVL
jgi:hypothetical protein